jgi:hypothetical protein
VDCAGTQLSLHIPAGDPGLATAALLSENVLACQFCHNLERVVAPNWVYVAASAAQAGKHATQMAVIACVVATCPAPQSQPLQPSMGEVSNEGAVPTNPGTALPVQVWRYANSVPLLGSIDESLSCACTAAVRAVRWADLGYKLRLATADSATATLPPLLQHSGGPGTPLPQHPWELVPLRPDTQCLLQERQLQVLLAVDARAAHGEHSYGSVQRSC